MVLGRILFLLAFATFSASAFAQTQLPTSSAVPADNSPLAQITQNSQNRLECPSVEHCRLTGEADIEIAVGTRFSADEIDVYTKPTLRIVASGNVVFSGPDGSIAAEQVEFNVIDGTGTFHRAAGIMSLGDTVDRVQFGNQEPDVYFYGDTVEKIGQQSYRLTRGGFTTCVQPTPRWEVTSNSVVINLGDYVIARNMLLRVKGVPLMYLPIIYYPIKEQDRATGFLLPTYGSLTLRGQAISNAFFWAIGRSQDATLFHDWFTRTGQGAGAEYRYVSGPSSYGNFRFYHLDQHETTFVQGDPTTTLPAQSSYYVQGSSSQAVGTAIRLHQRIDYKSNLVTSQLYQQNLYQASNATRTIEAGAMGSFGALTAGALFQRIETFTDADSSQVYGSSPRLTASIAPQRLFGLPVYGSVNNEYAFLPYRRIEDGEVSNDKSLGRFDILPTVRAALSRLAYLTVNTSASYRTTYYTRSADEDGRVTNEPLTRQYLTLRADVVGPVLTKIWDTPASGYSERMKHLIEPTFAIEFIPAIGNADQVLTLEDSRDVINGDSTRLTYGLNNRLLYRARTADGSAGSTIQFLTIGVQQTYYVTERASLNDQEYVSNDFRSRSVDLSDVALDVRLTPIPALDATTRLEYDVHGEGLHVMTTGGTLAVRGSSSTINYSRRRRTPTSDLESSMTWSSSVTMLQGQVRGAYALTWDIGRGEILDQSLGVTYMAQCCGVQAEFQRFNLTRNSPIASDRRFNLSFVLAGLGTFSNFFGAFGGLTGSGM